MARTDYKNTDLSEYVVEVRKISKATKGGRSLSYRVSVLVGDGKGNIGFGIAKHNEVMEAKNKATRVAKSKLVFIKLKDGRTIFHSVVSKFGASLILLKPARSGTGIIAGGPVRKFCEVLGITDVVTKSYGTSSVHCVIYNMFKAFKDIFPPRYIANKRARVDSVVEGV